MLVLNRCNTQAGATDIYFAGENVRVTVDEEPGQVAEAFTSASGLPFRLTARGGRGDVYVNQAAGSERQMVLERLREASARGPNETPVGLDHVRPTHGRRCVCVVHSSQPLGTTHDRSRALYHYFREPP